MPRCHHKQVLRLDNFVSMEALKKSTNEETVAHVKALIVKKLRNQFNLMTKTDTKHKLKFINGELVYWHDCARYCKVSHSLHAILI